MNNIPLYGYAHFIYVGKLPVGERKHPDSSAARKQRNKNVAAKVVDAKLGGVTHIVLTLNARMMPERRFWILFQSFRELLWPGNMGLMTLCKAVRNHFMNL